MTTENSTSRVGIRYAIAIKPMTEIADFSIWAKVRPGAKREFRKWMAAETGWREIDVHRLYGHRVDAGLPVELFKHLGWEDAHLELEKLPAFVEAGTGQLTVTFFSPDEQGPFCSIHSLYIWGLGCPVCEDNYIHRGRWRE